METPLQRQLKQQAEILPRANPALSLTSLEVQSVLTALDGLSPRD